MTAARRPTAAARPPRPAVLPAAPRRWSTRARERQAFDERLRLSLGTFRQPSVRDASRDASRDVVRTAAEAAYAVTRTLGLSVSLLDHHDGEAVRRGARVNRDGRLLFGIAARW